MYENLQREIDLTTDPVDLRDRELAGQDHSRTAQLLCESDPFFARDRHLGRCVDFEVWGDRADQSGEAEVLNDHGVNARLDDQSDGFLQVGELVGKDKRVERDVTTDAASMQEGHDFGQVGPAEVGGACPRIVAWEPEINGIGPVFDGRDHAFPVARGSEEFRLAGCSTRVLRLARKIRGRHGYPVSNFIAVRKFRSFRPGHYHACKPRRQGLYGVRWVRFVARFGSIEKLPKLPLGSFRWALGFVSLRDSGRVRRPPS